MHHCVVSLTKVSKDAKIRNRYNQVPHLRPSQGFWGTGEIGHLFQGNSGTKAKF